MLSKHCESICFLILLCVVIGLESSSIANGRDDDLFLQRLKDRLIAVTNLQQSSPEKAKQQSVPMDIDNNAINDDNEGPSQYQNPVDAIRETIINTIIREVSNNLPEVLRQTTEFFSQMRAAIVQAFTEYAEQNPNYLNESSTNRTLGAQFIKIVDSIVDDKGNRFNESQSLNYVP